MGGRNRLAILLAVVLAALAFVWLQARSVGSRITGVAPPLSATPEESTPHEGVRTIEPQPAGPLHEGGPDPARMQVESEPSQEPSREDVRPLGDAFRIAVRLTTSTGEPLDGHFKDDAWHGGYVSQITVVPTSEPLPLDVSSLNLERLRCGTYTRSWGARNTSFSGMVPDQISGIIDLSRQPPAYANAMLRGRVLASATIEATTREVVLVIDPDRTLATLGGLTFRLLDASTLEPIAKAGVSLAEGTTGVWANPYQLPLEGGRFERQRLPPGPYEVQIRLPGFEHLVRHFDVTSGLTTDLGDLLIEEGGAVRGRVVDEAGNGLSVPLVWSDIDVLYLLIGPPFIQTEASNPDGQFVLAELPPNGVILQTADPQWALDPITIRLSPGAIVEDVVLVARSGVPVTLNTRSGDTVEYEVVLRREDGQALWCTPALGPSSYEVRLVPGTYRLEVLAGGVLEKSRAFDVADQPLTVELSL